MENLKSNENDALPVGLKAAVILTALMVYRVIFIPFVWGGLGTSTPEVWQIPFAGDAFVGLASLPVAYMLWKRRGLMAWTVGIVFHVIGIKDFSVAGQLAFLAPSSTGPEPAVGALFMLFGISVQLLVIALLVRNRDYYLGFDRKIR